MLTELKIKLIQEPLKLVELLEVYSFDHISVRPSINCPKEIRFARDADGGGNNICIKLENNNDVMVRDFVKNFSSDIIGYIMEEREVDFKSVLSTIKKVLGLSPNWQPKKTVPFFGGFFDDFQKNPEPIPEVYPESILEEYEPIGNERFVRDHIGLDIQRLFDVGYDGQTQRIIFPIRNESGEIIGIKGRRNYETDDECDPKYLYLVKCPMSQTLYGYNVNYSSMYNNEVLIVESEKTVMQLKSYGYDNVVALGSNSLSEKQSKLISQLHPQRIIMGLDEGLEFKNTEKNIKTLKALKSIENADYYYWDSTIDPNIAHTKGSPGDFGKEYFYEIMKKQIKKYEE